MGRKPDVYYVDKEWGNFYTADSTKWVTIGSAYWRKSDDRDVRLIRGRIADGIAKPLDVIPPELARTIANGP